MAATVTAFTSACFGTTSPDSVNINLFGANFLVVAVGWSSASSAYTPPLVACNGEVMTLVTSAREWDTASGAVAIYTLPIFNAANTSVPITLTQTTFVGNVQIAAYAYTNSSQSLGVIVTDEYGTNSSGVNTGTTAINGVSTASVFTFAGFTFFGGTPTSITFPVGWTAGNQATASNEGVYCAYTNQTGNYSVTVTPSPNSFFNMLCMGWEVRAGQSPSTGGGANLVAYTSAAFGSVTAAAPGSTTFDPTTAANLLVATVGWASSSTLTAAQAVVTFAGSTMRLHSAPQKIDGSNGAVAVWTLPLSNAASGTFTFNCSPNFAGLTSVVLTAYSNASGTFGVTVIDEYGSNGVEVASGTTAISGVTYGSSFSYVAMGFFGNAPTYLDCSTGWNPISNASATNQSVYAFNYRYQNQNSFSITLQNPTVDFNTLNVGYEVSSAGTGLRQVPIGSFPFGVLLNETRTSQVPTGGAALVDQTILLSSSASITGVTGTGAASSPSPSFSLSQSAPVTGVAGTGNAGTLSVLQASTVSISGVGGTGHAAQTTGQNVQYTHLNPGDLSNCTLSNGFLTATGSTNGGVRTVDSYWSGKYYYELTATTITGNDCGIGMSEPAADFLGITNNAAGAAMAFNSTPGRVFVNTQLVTSLGAWTNGCVISVALDVTNKLIYFRLNGGDWNNSALANPATQTGGESLATLALPYMGCVTVTAGCSLTANFGQSAFIHPVPAGFTAGLPAGQQLPWYPGLNRLRQQQNPLAYEDEQLQDGWQRPQQRLTRSRTTWLVSSASVAKQLDYVVLSLPASAVNTAKTVDYVVLDPPVAANVAKVVNYLVLQTLPQPKLPDATRVICQAREWEHIDDADQVATQRWRTNRLDSVGIAQPPIAGTIAGASGTGAAGRPTDEHSLIGVTGFGISGVVATTFSTEVSVSGTIGFGSSGIIGSTASKTASVSGVIGTGISAVIGSSSMKITAVSGIHGTGQRGLFIADLAVLIGGVSGTGRIDDVGEQIRSLSGQSVMMICL